MNSPELYQCILWCLPYVALCMGCIALNLPKSVRSRQFAMPIVAVLYCLIIMTTIERLTETLREKMSGYEWIMDLLGSTQIDFFIVCVINTAILLIFFVVKAILLAIFNVVWKSQNLMELTSSKFYDEYINGKIERYISSDLEDVDSEAESDSSEADVSNSDSSGTKKNDGDDKKKDDVHEWILKIKYSQFRTYYWGFYIALIFVSSIVLMLSLYCPEWECFQGIFYPVFAVILLGEIVFYLSGPTECTPVKEKTKAPVREKIDPNFEQLINTLNNTYDDNNFDGYPIQMKPVVSDCMLMLEELAASPEHDKQLIAGFFKKLEAEKIEFHEDDIQTVKQLLAGKSTLICNPFYRDLTNVLILPMFRQLMNYKKCLVIVGRETAVEDVAKWIDSALFDYTGTNSLWTSEVLSLNVCDSDIGILKFSDIYNLKLHHINHQFLQSVGFVLIIEPSRILATAQMGLSIIVSHCETDDKDIVYCACDRNCDGLVDSLSHALKTNLTEVVATQAGSGFMLQNFWYSYPLEMQHRILPTVSRDLGFGTDLGLFAFHFGIRPVKWISSDKFPIYDIKWIDGQYYQQLCEVSGLPATQAAFNENFIVETNLWNQEKDNELYLTLEDEFQNLFEIGRVFKSRSRKVSIVNVLCESYLLRDYMLDNLRLFAEDAKALPTFVPDFARTERNSTLKLIMMMANAPVREEIIERELMLCGITSDDVYTTLQRLIMRHCRTHNTTLAVHFADEALADGLTRKTVRSFEIQENDELADYAQKLKTAYFLAEDEIDSHHYIGAKLYGHVFQTYLPGQFVCMDGKYYEVLRISAQNGVIIRRAADYINGRKYYRQLRNITLSGFDPEVTMGSSRSVCGLEFTRGFADFSVETKGYLELSDYHDLKNAKEVLINGIPEREYINKSALRIRLPNVTNDIRYTICILLNEIFRTTYPDVHQFVSAVMPLSEIKSSRLKPLLFDLAGECEDDCIYILEDSEIDMGLVVSIERNLKRYFEIITELLLWHGEKMLEVAVPGANGGNQDDEAESGEEEPSEHEDEEASKSLWQRIKAWFASLFDSKQTEKLEVYEVTHNEDFPDDEVSGEENAPEDEGAEEELPETEYQKHCFLKFGFEEFDSSLLTYQTLDYLCGFGFDENQLTHIRKYAVREYVYEPSNPDAHYCDFCGIEMADGKYRTLSDKREQCSQCQKTAIDEVSEFRKLFRIVKKQFETVYRVRINIPIHIYLTTAEEIAAETGETFVPTPGFDPRSVGFARHIQDGDKNEYSIYIEKSSPRDSATATIAHELTHIWQYLNWDMEALRALGDIEYSERMEGMATWSEIQFMYAIGRYKYATRLAVTNRKRFDVYGRGLVRYEKSYPLATDGNIKKSPFKKNN